MEFWIPLNEYEKIYPARYRALYHALRAAIRSGEIPVGTRLPSSRDLARQYRISRGTITRVYEMLLADDFLISRHGEGTYVAPAMISPHATPAQTKTRRPRLSRWARRIPKPPARIEIPRQNLRFDLRVGTPDPEIFPERQWKRAMMQAIRQDHHTETDALRAPAGVPDLRQAIAAHLNQRRGLNISAEHVEVVSGSQQALALLIQMLVDPGQPVVLENPGYYLIRNAVSAAGGRIIPAPVDTNGICISDWRARLLIVTPSHQFPTGTMLSRERRRQILEWARKRDAVIIEDDYDSEFKREGLPVEPLRALDHNEGRVIYTGTFSRTIHPGIRLGYVILPEVYREPFRRARRLFESGSPSRLEQMTLAAFMQSGEYEKHLRRSIRVYRERHRNMMELFARLLPGAFNWNPSNAGLHIFGAWQVTGNRTLAKFTDACNQRGVYWSPAETFYMGRRPQTALFGFSRLDEGRTAAALKIMARVFKEL